MGKSRRQNRVEKRLAKLSTDTKPCLLQVGSCHPKFKCSSVTWRQSPYKEGRAAADITRGQSQMKTKMEAKMVFLPVKGHQSLTTKQQKLVERPGKRAALTA